MRWVRWAFLGYVFVGCSEAESPPVWTAGTVYPSPTTTTRSLRDVRGLIHAHSIYSHDACDNEPVKDGIRDPVCFDDFRRGICQVKDDFVFLTDHPSDFADTPFEQAVLYREELGDELVIENGKPVGSWLHCEDDHRVLILPGAESDLMPVGLTEHVADYGLRTAEGVTAMKTAGGIVLKAHTEDTNPDEIINLDLDGFEMHNLHANALLSAGVVIELILLNAERPAELPHPDLVFLPMLQEDPRYVETWGTVLSRGKHVVTTMGSDCHRNSFKAILPDGERGDSYRRMMMGMSNHLWVEAKADGSFTKQALEEALKSARAYGAFEVMGYPVGFEFTASAKGTVHEMGADVPLADQPELFVKAPSIRDLDPARPAPEMTVRLLKAREGGFDEVASEQGDVHFRPTEPGAYRAEVRLKPRHLAADLGKYAPEVSNRDQVWIYSNAIFIQ